MSKVAWDFPKSVSSKMTTEEMCEAVDQGSFVGLVDPEGENIKDFITTVVYQYRNWGGIIKT
jgi:hypothetical protein